MLVAACGNGGGFADAPAPPPPPAPGTFALSWSLMTSSAQPSNCTEAGASSVQVGVVDQASGSQDSASFDCALGSAVSGSLFAGTYGLTFALLGPSGVVATASAQTVAIVSDRTTQLDPVVFLTQ